MNDKAPPAKPAFSNAAKGGPVKKTAPSGSGIATAAELKKLHQERKVQPPRPQPAPPPGAAQVVKKEAAKRDARMQDLDKRLGKSKDRFERDFDRSRGR